MLIICKFQKASWASQDVLAGHRRAAYFRFLIKVFVAVETLQYNFFLELTEVSA